jgi:hypothetical protein
MTFQSAQSTKSGCATQALKRIVVYTLLLAGVGSAICASASTPTTATLALTSDGTTVTTVASGSVVTLTATVKAGSAAVTVGQVKFCDATATYCEDSAVLGTAQLTAAGTATLNLRLGVGSHSIKAQFVGTTTNAASTSTTQSVAVTGKAWSASALAVTGIPGNYTLTATVAGGGESAPTGSVSLEDSSNGNAILTTDDLDAMTAAQTFASSTYPTGSNPYAVAVADFNRDGIPDLAVTNNGSNTVSVLLGKGDGTFQSPQTYTTGYRPMAVAVGDFNMDGIPDLVVANWQDHTLSVLLGNGDGTFKPQMNFPVGDGPLASPVSGSLYLAVGDLNHDGIPDVVVSIQSTQSVYVLLGNGDGTFQAQKEFAGAGDEIALADFDGDGNLDIADANGTILLGNSDGTFRAGTDISSGGSYIAVGDFNGDGKPDLAVRTQSAITVYLNSGSATFQSSYSYAPNCICSGSVTVGDFNLNGHQGLIVGAFNTSILFLGNGDGTFAPQSAQIPTGSIHSAGVADFNGDGRPDLAVPANLFLNEVTVQAKATSFFILGGNSTHTVQAAYGGDSAYAPSTSNAVTLARGVSTSLAIAGTPTGVVASGKTVQLTATLTPDLYNSVPASGTVTFSDYGTAIGAPVSISSSGQAVLTTGALAAGGHSFSAAYSGDGNFAAAQSGTVAVWATISSSTTLSVSANSVSPGTDIVLTAAVKDQNSVAVKSGQVQFCNAAATYCEGSALLGIGQLTSTGVATLNLRLGIGTYTIKAVFSGTATVAPSTSTGQSVAVAGKVWSASALSLAGVPGNYTLTATVTGGGKTAPTGTVAFEDASNGNATVATASLDGTTALATFGETVYANGESPNPIVVGDFNGDGKPVIVGGAAAGDFNGDGKLDLVVTNAAANTFGVLLGNGDGSFQAQQNYTVGAPPTSQFSTTPVALGDFNGDGNLDIVAISSTDNTLHLFLGKGDGTFEPGQLLATVLGVSTIAVGDFNGDGIPDLAVLGYPSSYVGSVTILLGNGDGTFQTGATYAAGSGGYIAAGDFNGDGKQDIVVVGFSETTILLGNGNGTFQAQTGVYLGWNSAVSLAVGDLNGDGKLDLAVADWYGGIWVASGNGDGTFQPANPYGTGSGWQALALGDFNGDGRLDIAATYPSSNTVVTLLNEWTVKATASKVFVLGGAATHSVSGAYGGDNNYASSNSNAVTLVRGVSTSLTLTPSPSGSVQAGQTVQLTAALAPATYSGNTASGTLSIYDNGVVIDAQAIGASGQVTFTTAALTAGSHSFTASYPGDNNFAPASSGDEVVWATSKTTTTLAASANSVTVGTAVSLTATVKDLSNAPVTGGQVKFCVASATYCQDAAVLGTAQVTAAGTASVNLQLGIGSYSIKAVFVGTSADSTSTSSPQTLAVSGQALTATWLAESGAVGNYTLTATVAGYGRAVPSGAITFEDTSNGNATVATATLNATTAFASFAGSSYATGTSSRSVAWVDFNGDGKLDLVLANRGDNTVSVLLGVGDGTFQKQVTYATGVQPGSVAVGDFNGDGKLDLVVTNYSDNTVSVLLGKGDGTFQAQKTYATGTGPSVVAVGDFNGDGKQDLVVANYNDNSISVLLGKGDGTFQTPVAFASGGYPSFVAVGDFNGDGRLDVVVSDANDNTVSVLLGNGDGTFQTRQTFAVGSVPYSVAVADLNDDGKLDLVVADSGYNPNFTDNFPKYVSVLLGNGDGTFQKQQSYQVGNEPFSVAVSDINGDGKLDLAVANRLDNTVSTLIGNGDGTFQPQVIYATGSGPTSIVAADFNGDGRPDLAVADLNDNTVTLFVNQANVLAAASNVFVVGGAATHTVVAAYGGDSVHQSSTSSSVSLSAGVSTTTALTSSLNPAAFGASITFTAIVNRPNGVSGVPTGTVTFMDGSKTSGSGQLDGTGKATYTTASLTVGSHSITAVYGGDSNDATSTSPALTEVVNSNTTPTVTITLSPTNITTAQVLTVTISVGGVSGNPTPTGSVKLSSGSYTSAVTTLNGGSVTISVPAGSLAVGTDTLTATYTPDATSSTIYNSASNTASITVTTAPPSFALGGTSVTVTPGATTGNISTITVTPSGGFTGSVALTAALTSSPAGAQYPPTLSFGSTTPVGITGTTAGTATLTVSTTAATSAALAYPKSRTPPWYPAGGAVLAALLLFGIPARRGSWRTMLGMLFLLVALGGGVLACGGGGSGGGGGGGGSGNPGTTAGAYTVTATGTSGSLTQTTTLTVTVN